MTIDENYTERLVNAVAKTLVEALERLTIEDVNMYQLGYNKAIVDFADKIRKKIEISMIPRANELETIQALEELMSYSIGRIAEQLKAGGS